MTELLARLKPAASRRVRLGLAAATWTAVGLGLLIAGVHFFVASQRPLHPAFLAAAAAVGLIKALLVLRPAAHRVIGRIQASGDDRCIGGFFSWQTWIVVAVMIAAGVLFRNSHLSRAVVGLVYVAVGVALLSASALPWRAWYRGFGRPAAGA
jgi:hypothetical protein